MTVTNAFATQHLVDALRENKGTMESIRNFLSGCSWQARDGLRVYCKVTNEERDFPDPTEAVLLFLASYWLENYQFQLLGLGDEDRLSRVNTLTLITITPPDIFQTARNFNAAGWLVRQQLQLDLMRMTTPTTRLVERRKG